MFAISFPVIDPIAIEIGPIAIRWYALAYIAGIIGGWRYALWLAKRPPQAITRQDIDDFIVWATLGIVLGGRLGYVLFYKPDYYLQHPLEALMVWQGGMSFHGGALGVILGIIIFARRRGIDVLALGDLVVTVVPIGLGLGRIANFINAELWGRATDVPWAMIFPSDPAGLPRHPSQLYQAFLEGLVLFVVLSVLAIKFDARRRPGLLSGVFLAGYAVARMVGELFRQPDAHLGFLVFGATMGQLLSLPMLLVGLWLILRARARVPQA